jgi:hypothetical protein
MTKFLVLYRSSVSAIEQMSKAPPEQAKAGMDAWMAWAQAAGTAIVDLGQPLQPVARVGSGATSASDSHIGGFSILQAESRPAVEALLENHPHLMAAGGWIDVHEFLAMPGM